MKSPKKFILLTPIILFIVFLPFIIPSQNIKHERITIKGFDGNPLSIDSKIPYSPKKTCGGCHNYDQITKGYHFQQGRTDETGKISISDTFDSKYPWNLSSGMYGKHMPIYFDLSQLAKKGNKSPSEIDKSSFFYVENCGSCHTGGGWGEYDRKGNLYYDEESRRFGYEISGDSPELDGDYSSFSMGDPNYGAPWNQSGVSEADCLICHLKGYKWIDRSAAMKSRLFKYGPTIGAGWANIKFSQDASGNQRAQEIDIDYIKKDTSSFEDLHLNIIRNPPDDNCLFCHGISGRKKRGFRWDHETDVHKSKGLECIYCHRSDKEHNFAKGDSLNQTVRDDLDNTMNSCEDCHLRKKDRKAPRYRHPFSPRHMKIIACQTCHIPYLWEQAELVYDHSSGETSIYETIRFLSNDPLDPKKSLSEINPNIWYPSLKIYKGKIIPVNSIISIFWGDLDENTNVIRPIPLWKIRNLKKPLIKDENEDGIPEINTTEEIKSFLKVLKKSKDIFGNPVAIQPVLVKGEYLYRLGKKGELERIKHEQARLIELSISHNVVSGKNVIGSRGCKDCHSKNSTFFLRKILIDPYDEKGRPVYIEAWERLGISKEKLGRLLLEQ